MCEVAEYRGCWTQIIHLLYDAVEVCEYDKVQGYLYFYKLFFNYYFQYYAGIRSHWMV